MGFVRTLCTEQLLDELALPSSLKTTGKLNLIGRNLIQDCATSSALIPHPYHYSDYPDCEFSFYVKGKHFSVVELTQRSDGPDRVEIWFNADMDEAACVKVTKLLDAAFAVMRDEALNSLPIIVHRPSA